MLLCVVVQCFWVLYQEKMVKEDDFLHICGQNIGHFGSRCNTGLALVWYSACILHIVSTKCITVYSVLTPCYYPFTHPLTYSSYTRESNSPGILSCPYTWSCASRSCHDAISAKAELDVEADTLAVGAVA